MDHGDDPVVITWNKKHTHEVSPLADEKMKKKVRAESRERVAEGLSSQTKAFPKPPPVVF